MVESYRGILEEMINDKVHGASWYFLKLADLIEAGYREGINVESMINDISMIRPGMAPLENIAELLNQVNPVKLAKAIRAYWREAGEGIRVNSLTLKGRVKVMVTISYSSNARLLAESVGARIIALESHPGGEGKMWSSHGGLIVPDLTMSYFMTNADALVMGSDGLYEGFIVNKIGSLPLVLTARYFGKPVIIVLESFKARKSKPMIMHKINVNGIEVPLFDEIPLNLVDILVTDVGVFTSISVDYIASKFKERLLKHI
ncbi:hypothetical protein [Caldivirga sp. UBA161]|uniref:hypothetical protein n=1 Tax=Caldivirga sp. UBA161 TaxID=1915569 RepID=UPI0025BBB3D8|nr:hypothetical protein [Caldivirga sp. UBA161]